MKEIVSSNYSVWIERGFSWQIRYFVILKSIILVDENTKRDCLHKLPKIDSHVIIEVKSGEHNKTISTCNYIWENL